MINPHLFKLARLILASSRLKTLKLEPMRRALRKPVQLNSTSLKSKSSKIEYLIQNTAKKNLGGEIAF
jgi:hypothetical protein